jgi:hypothetical protein
MNGNFDNELTLIWANKGVAVSGPLEEWDEDETGASIYVTISQNDVVASGRTGNDVPNGAEKFIVAAGVEGDGKLSPGTASASGWAFPRGGKRAEAYEWSEVVTLSEPPQGDMDRDLSPGRHGRTPAH